MPFGLTVRASRRYRGSRPSGHSATAALVEVIQPAKFAGIMAIYSTSSGVPMTIWALPPTQNPADLPQGPDIQVARLLSFMTYGDWNAPIQGLDQFPARDWPPIALSFLSYHNMVLLGTLMLLVMAFGAYYLWQRSLFRRPFWLRAAVVATPLPLIAIQLGWATAEIGRQPWIVYGVMRTTDGVSRIVPPEQIAISLGLLVGLYVLLGALWLYLMRRELGHGPEPAPGDGADEAALDELPRHEIALRPGQTAA